MPHPIDPRHVENDWSAWFAAARTEAVDAAIQKIYADLDAEIARRSPTCWLSGKCCHFESYGHRLYVTGLEVAWVLEKQKSKKTEKQKIDPEAMIGMDGCPFQDEKLCGAHAVRPLGCRIYYCDPTAQDWQQDVYEMYLNQLRALHDEQGIDYGYMEWRAGLAEGMQWMTSNPQAA